MLILKSSISPHWAPKMHSQLDHFSHIHLVNSCGAERRESHYSHCLMQQYPLLDAEEHCGVITHISSCERRVSEPVWRSTERTSCLQAELSPRWCAPASPAWRPEGQTAPVHSRGRWGEGPRPERRRSHTHSKRQSGGGRGKLVEVVDEPDFLSASVC